MNKKLIAILALVMVATAACTGSKGDSGSSGGKVTIRWATWGTPEDLSLMD
ncbi:hypothetical protein Drose_14555 [Dactylosporangium roseum]|uniref:Uncharacterized protein n=1 Tax=Dactylosporangium roseum TaxID=47989 RepID=A0ABY5ZCP5_9ACTN|nr:hypothetical protein [Dactylosporangium roseum]UWZ39346.1 hypothetical protein Drose_14555 [Dactylosporangium roseum]